MCLNYLGNIDFTTSWEGFGILWEFMQKHELWTKFISKQIWNTISEQNINKFSGIFERLISPAGLAIAVVEFFEEKQP